MPQFQFSLVSPERELYSGDVDAVLVPGTEGLFEVRADHAPVMATLSPGLLEVHVGGEVSKTYVRGGFADVSGAGLTVLAEKAVAASDLQGELLTSEREAAQAILDDGSASPESMLGAQRTLAALEPF